MARTVRVRERVSRGGCKSIPELVKGISYHIGGCKGPMKHFLCCLVQGFGEESKSRDPVPEEARKTQEGENLILHFRLLEVSEGLDSVL